MKKVVQFISGLYTKGYLDILKKIFFFLMGFIASYIIIERPGSSLKGTNLGVEIHLISCYLTTSIAIIMILIKKTRFFGLGLILPAGFFSFVYYILYLLFGNGFP